MTALSRLARVKGHDRPSVLLTTINAALQRVPAREFVATHALSVAPGSVVDMASIIEWLELNGYMRASTVREPGEYAVRGGILDLFPPGMDLPVRLDFFGDTLESIKTFDPQTQRTDRHAARARSACRSPKSSSSPRPSAASAPAMWPHSARNARRSALRGRERRPPLSRHGALAAAVPYADGNAVRLSARHAARARSSRRGRRARALQSDRGLLRRPPRGAEGGRDAGLQAAAAGQALSRRERMEGTARGFIARAADALRGAGSTRRDRYRRACRAQFRGRTRRAERQCVRGRDQACARQAGGRQARRHRAAGARARASA